jgi:hypothetical protein
MAIHEWIVVLGPYVALLGLILWDTGDLKGNWLIRLKADWPMFAATLLLAILTGALWQATSDLVRDAKHTADRQLRAYVFLRDIRLQKRNDDDFDVIPEWENSGATETIGMTAQLNRHLADRPLPEWFSYGDVTNDHVPIVLGPHATSNITFTTISKICLSQLNRRDGVDKFYIWGWTKYRDTETRDEHTTRFCWDIDQATFSQGGNTVRLSHKLCARGNCVDDQYPQPVPGAYQIYVAPCKADVVKKPVSAPPQPG